MTIHQMKRRLNRIKTESFRLAEMHSDKEQERYAPTHPQMKSLYMDIAFLADAVLILERGLPKNKEITND